jgi:hypothetical protein
MQGRIKRPPNKRRRERARRSREAWIERRNCSSPSINTAISAATAACTAAAGEKIPAAATTVAEKLSAAATTAAAASATTAATSVDITAAADVGIGTTGVKAFATTAAERSKVWAGERRSSARASVFEQRRNSLVSASQESPEKLRGAEDLNESFRIQFEKAVPREELVCSSCLSTHHAINNPLYIFCGWKVLE